MNTHHFSRVPANIDANNRHENDRQCGVQKPQCQPNWNKQQCESRTKGARCFWQQSRAKSNTAKHDAAVEPRHVFKIDCGFMQNVGIHEIAVDSVHHPAQKLIPFVW